MDGLHIIKSIAAMPHMFVGGVPSERAGDSRLASVRLGAGVAHRIGLTSPEFSQGEPIPRAHSAEGASISPPLNWVALPEKTRSLLLICEDPDAPTPLPFVHWLLYDVPPELLGVPAGLQGRVPDELCGGHVGKNSFMQSSWAGCAPPKGDSAHHYHFQLFALDKLLAIEPGAGRSRILEGTGLHVIGFGELVGTYQR